MDLITILNSSLFGESPFGNNLQNLQPITWSLKQMINGGITFFRNYLSGHVCLLSLDIETITLFTGLGISPVVQIKNQGLSTANQLCVLHNVSTVHLVAVGPAASVCRQQWGLCSSVCGRRWPAARRSEPRSSHLVAPEIQFKYQKQVLCFVCLSIYVLNKSCFIYSGGAFPELQKM